MPKALTREQLAARKEKGVRFVEDVLGDPDRADEIAEESLDDYAARRGIEIVENPRGGRMSPQVRVINPSRAELLEELRRQRAKTKELESQLAHGNPRERNVQPVSSRPDLLAQIRELRQENDELQDKLDKVAELAEAPEDSEEEDIDDLKDALNQIIDVAAGEEHESEADRRGNE